MQVKLKTNDQDQQIYDVSRDSYFLPHEMRDPKKRRTAVQAWLRGDLTGPRWKSVDYTNGIGNYVEHVFHGTPQFNYVGWLKLGTGPQQRIGRKVTLKKMNLRFNLAAQYGTPPPGPYYSNADIGVIAVVYDRQPGSFDPTYADIFGDYNSTSSTIISDAVSGQNRNNEHRFLILWQRVLYMPGFKYDSTNLLTQQFPSQAPQSLIFAHEIDLMDLPVVYGADSAAQTDTDVRTGRLMVWTANSFYDNTNLSWATADFYCRVFYDDDFGSPNVC